MGSPPRSTIREDTVALFVLGLRLGFFDFGSVSGLGPLGLRVWGGTELSQTAGVSRLRPYLDVRGFRVSGFGFSVYRVWCSFARR